ncbi:MAG TPA: calcium-translocating P-type ATPase, PMCA-type [Candidatus Borkfalkia excrementigallinarum]|uniref:P-type Ca(2+) transporter n=1 Tax=Candidatus Borkfalkia excrementigallinarum TaxID=2838506 RepID=A0A9D1ZY14_9FIRM|nr:calcium-translocating P-type ATPase, PMCA-type [Candidatus Borkfalkia excrementigallinarum]
METQPHKPWHSLSCEETEKILNTSKEGLSDAEAAKRLQQYGKNNLRQKKPKSIAKMIWEQITDVMVLILIAAAVFSFVMSFFEDGEGLAECIVILVVIVLNATIGVVQEKKAANALEALKNMTAPTARVLREGEESVVPASELVPGDIVYLEDGCIVPADIRIIQDSNMKVQEAALTGESVPSEKDGPTVLPEDAPLGDRINMAYSSSVVMYGNATGIVVGTGMNTEVGKIANLLDEQDETDTPMKRKLNSVGKTLSLVGLIVCVVIFAIGLIRDGWAAWINYVFIAISLAISIIPEGLPATSTIIMALGVQRMAKKNALVKSLPAVETLGSATVVCCDKTGTLTLNKMTVTHLAVGDDFLQGVTTKAEELSKKYDRSVYQDLLSGAALCINAKKDPDNPGNILGDPTEGALVYLAEKFGIDTEDYEDAHPRAFEQPFDSDRKRMSVLNRMEGGLTVYTKGAVDEMLPLCTKYRTASGMREMTDADREQILKVCNGMSAEALRVLGFAVRSVSEVPEDEGCDLEQDMTFVGVVGMIDPPRKEVIQAVETCHTAGIRVVMITGDHKVTAMAIAKQLHIFREGNTVISGQELDEMTDEQLDEAVKTCVVFARVSPSDKLRIIQSLKRTGEVAAMTGDGVNDSPALKEADIGVAMGITGTDVAKDAADVILLDDNFTTIEYAIREGRRVYRNIQKVIQFLVAGNIAEILILLLAVVFGWQMPILAVHILLINLATDSLPAVALGVDPASANIMKHKPIKSGTLFERGMIYRIVLHGLFISAAALAAYWIGMLVYENHDESMTMTFIVLSVSQLSHALNQRSNTDSIFKRGQGHNKFLAIALLASAAIVALVVFVPPLMRLFDLVYIGWTEWLICIGLSVFPLVAVEISKIFIHLYAKHGKTA